MDRRTVLAMVLFFGLFLVWTKVMERYRPEPSPVDETTVAQTIDPLAADSRPEPTPLVPAEVQTATAAAATGEFPTVFVGQTSAETVEIETDLYIATYATTGGVLVGWQGKRFPGHDGTDYVELVPERTGLDQPPRGDVLVFEDGTFDLTDAPFTSGAGFRLAEGDPTRELVLTARLADGTEIRKVLTFTPGDYAIGMRYDVSPGASGLLPGEPVSARFVWDQGIAVTEAAMKMMMRGAFGNKAFALVGEEYDTRNSGNLGKDDGSAFGSYRGSVRFAGLQSKYFTILGFVPSAAERAFEGRIRLGGDPETGHQSW